MTATQPDVSLLGRYQTCAAARVLGVDRHHVSRWAASGELRPGGVTASGRVWFTGRELTAFWQRYWGKR